MRPIRSTLTALAITVLALVATDAAPANPGNFLIGCNHDHVAGDDPIVHPGEPGDSHIHEFSGSVGINAFSTFTSMRAAGTTCDLPGDTAGYWIPTVIAADGSVVHSTGAEVYYLGQDQPVIPFPTGLKHVQGDPNNMTGAHYAATYGCGTAAGGTTIPTSCPAGKGVRMSVYFPMCWNGRELDNATHKTLGVCGPDFPVHVPQLQQFYDFPPAAVGGRLSSDLAGVPAGVSGHADFWNTWDPFTLAKVVELCVNVPDRACRVDVDRRAVVDVAATGRPAVFTF